MHYNSNSITIKANSVRDYHRHGKQVQGKFNDNKTKLRAKALELLLSDAYNLHGREALTVEEYQNYKEQFNRIVKALEEKLSTKL